MSVEKRIGGKAHGQHMIQYFLLYIALFFLGCVKLVEGAGHQHLVLGIDLGNDNSVVAAAGRGGVDVIPNGIGSRSTPSALLLGADRRYFGAEASTKSGQNPSAALVTQFRRLLGEGASVAAGASGGGGGVVEGRGEEERVGPEAASAMMLAHLAGEACRERAASSGSAGASCAALGLAAPAWLGPRGRAALRDAAALAGLPRPEIITDGTALVLAYGLFRQDILKKEEEQHHQQQKKANEGNEADGSSETSGSHNILFLDFGHSAAQATVACFDAAGARVAAHEWTWAAAGGVLDDALFGHFAAELAGRGVDVGEGNPRAGARLRAACARLKKTLSANAEASVTVECLDGDTDCHLRLTRDAFERKLDEAGAGEAVLSLCWRALAAAGLSVHDLAAVELVGGSSYVPYLCRAAAAAVAACDTDPGGPGSQRSPPPVRRSLNAGEALARGAALAAAAASPLLQIRKYKVEDCCSPAQAVIFRWKGEGIDGTGELVVKAGTCLPFEAEFEAVVQAEDFQLVVTCEDLAEWEVAPPPGGLGPVAAGEEVRVRGLLALGSDGAGAPELRGCRVLVGGFPPAGGQGGGEAALQPRQLAPVVTTRCSLGLSPEDMATAAAAETARLARDRQVVELADARNRLEGFIYETREDIGEYGTLGAFMTPEDLEKLNNDLDKTENWLVETKSSSSIDFESKLSQLQTMSSKAVELKETKITIEETINSSVMELNSAGKAVRTLLGEKIASNGGADESLAIQAHALASQLDNDLRWLEEQRRRAAEAPAHAPPPCTPRQVEEQISESMKQFKALGVKITTIHHQNSDNSCSGRKEEGGSNKMNGGEAEAS